MKKEDLRPIEITLKENKEEKKVKGYFHTWTTNIIFNGKRSINFGICELEDGSIIQALFTNIRFMDRN